MQIVSGIYLVGSQDCYLTYSDWYSPDCEYIDSNVFAVDLDSEIILFDVGNGDSLEQIFQNMRNWNLDPTKITHCFLTHPHYDHSAGAFLLQQHKVKIAAHRLCAEAIKSGDERACPYLYHRTYQPCTADIILDDESIYQVGSLTIEAFHAPGHANGSLVYSFLWLDRKVFVTGDVVAESGSLGWDGSIDFSPRLYIESLKKLARRPVDIILPGHRRPALSRGIIWVEQALNRAVMRWGSFTDDRR